MDDGGSIARLGLPPYLRSKLLACGYSSIADLHGASPLDLARDASISSDEALSVLRRIGATPAPIAGAKTAWDLMSFDRSRSRIGTGCSGLDRVFGGGVASKELTEICGAPGIGKTQLGYGPTLFILDHSEITSKVSIFFLSHRMQLAINVQLPRSLGGLNGHAVYIDTEGSFMMERVLQMAQRSALVTPDQSVESLLSHIFYFRVFDSTEQIATINSLNKFLEEHKEVKLLVIDSVTFHFRQDFHDLALRARLLNSMAQKLMALAHHHELAVVLVNQVTTKGNGEIRPALGESWSHACTNRVILRWEGGKRQACMFKSPSLPPAKSSFSITTRGIGE
ncbi:DNA repair protein RAD51 homolog 3-like isoform X1 [Selaginella moellendorffii]|uniref:DNA repair protein RAD51 homolog 3-like isoform X1 n=1 Tax=Selaginella moellendorffii TaxID=88036 RepID=UPI000D1CB4F7|nr:DNA repair protein RAD51 homolog 3-like isoform X1 [Selaginella moellendorffii]|eukprot:XP_024530646.1 DNA repair protein RAD51 homolog 3-like isoform X1 [Selaginella moellendorffii]